MNTTLSSPVARYAAAGLACAAIVIAGPYEGALLQMSAGMILWRALVAGIAAGLLWREGDAEWTPALVAGGATAVGCLLLVALYPTASLLLTVLVGIVAATLTAWGVAAASARGLSAGAVSAQRIATWAALVLLAASLLWQVGVLPGAPRTALAGMRQLLATDQVAEGYAFDGGIYEYTVTLMKGGTPYYDAFVEAHIGHADFDGAPKSAFNFRQRWLSEVWALVPGTGRSAPWTTLAGFSIAVMGAGYALARRYTNPGLALVAPAMLSGYYAYPLLTQWTTFSEYYGAGLVVIALALLVRKQWLAAGIALTAAVAARELMLIALPAFVLAWALYPDRKKALPGLVVAVAGPAAVLGYHLMAAPGTESAGLSALARWTENGGLGRLYEALTFSTLLVPLGGTIAVVWAVAALASGSVAKEWWERVALTGTPLLLLGLITAFSANEWDYYWGAIAVPVLIALAPVFLGWIEPAEELT